MEGAVTNFVLHDGKMIIYDDTVCDGVKLIIQDDKNSYIYPYCQLSDGKIMASLSANNSSMAAMSQQMLDCASEKICKVICECVVLLEKIPYWGSLKLFCFILPYAKILIFKINAQNSGLMAIQSYGMLIVKMTFPFY